MGLRDELADAEMPAASFSDAAAAAEHGLRSAIAFAASKLRLDTEATLQTVLSGNSQAQDYFHYGLARQVAEWLGTLDGNIQTVYLMEDEDFPSPLLHLIVWAQRKTEALSSLIAALDRALVQGYARLAGLPRLEHLLDVQVVDDGDVKGRVGYGVLLSSLHHKPLPIWDKTGGSGPG